jgi:hypothetical protein
LASFYSLALLNNIVDDQSPRFNEFPGRRRNIFFYKAFFIKKIPPNLYIKVGNKGNCKHELILGGIL